MPKLGEFIGALLADAAQARVRADLEAVRIAEAYASNELLKHMPVPHFRLPDISVDFPVMVETIGGDNQTLQLFSSPERTELTTLVRRAIASNNIKLSPQDRIRVYDAVAKKSAALTLPGSPALLSSNAIASALSDSAATTVKQAMSTRTDGTQVELSSFQDAVKSSMKTLLVKKLIEAPNLQVNVASSAIKAHGDNESLVRVRLTISEDAYELLTDDQAFRLIPE